MEDPAAWELYDVSRDRTELENIAEEMPDKARELLAAYLTWASRCNIMDYNMLRKL